MRSFIIIVIVSAFFIGTFNLIGRAELKNYDIDSVIAKILLSEGKIHDVSAKVSDRDNSGEGKLLHKMSWGFKNGKEYLKGKDFVLGNTENEEKAYSIIRAFDGEKTRMLEVDPRPDIPTRGRITTFDMSGFSSIGTPNRMLGYRLDQNLNLSLGELLRACRTQNKQLSVRTAEGDIDGHATCVVDGIEVCKAIGSEDTYDLRIWLDFERDYRPLKIERYYSLPGKKRWQAIANRIDNIKLKQVSGIWYPIQGDIEAFSLVYKKPLNYTDAQIASLTKEELIEKSVIENKPYAPKRRTVVDVSSIKINAGIPDDEFSLVFPQGCRLWDDFTQTGTKVGEYTNEANNRSINEIATTLPQQDQKDYQNGRKVVNSTKHDDTPENNNLVKTSKDLLWPSLTGVLLLVISVYVYIKIKVIKKTKKS